LRLYFSEQCLDPVFRSSVKTLNSVTFKEFLIHVGMHHTKRLIDLEMSGLRHSPRTAALTGPHDVPDIATY
jgi:hypothetical protein